MTPRAVPGSRAAQLIEYERLRRTVSVGNTSLAYWDTGGDGEPIVLMHSAYGSGEHWVTQLSSYHTAGYRPIAWSRRGHFGSGGDPNDPGSLVDDLEALAQALGLTRFHLVGVALGAFGALEYALEQPTRLLSLTLASSLCGISDPSFVAETDALVPKPFHELPLELQELSADYRFRDPDGVATWNALTSRAVRVRIEQPPAQPVTHDSLTALSMPALLLTGDADPYMPPTRMAALAARVPGSHFSVIPGAAHAPNWENPDAFDSIVLDFLKHLPRGPRGLPNASPGLALG